MRDFFAALVLSASLIIFPAMAASPAKLITIDNNAWAGSSVNVLAGVRQSVFTEGNVQYAGFYNQQGYLVLAKRALDQEQWQTRVSAFKANVIDAHNHLSLVVDGAGFLHVSFDHHNTPLKYAVSLQAGGIELGELKSMTGEHENSITYPQFYRMNNGDLLFNYRHGGSGRGVLVINHFDHKTGQWTRRHDALIDGEGKRSAYWDMTIDARGVLHLAWNWRETPDVASNYNLAYARSADQGKTWQTLKGGDYQIPITEASADYAAVIAQNSNLMNPPAIAADANSKPYIANYWSAKPGEAPRYRLVTPAGDGWQIIEGPETSANFSLSGMGTKRPPISRSVLLIKNQADSSVAHLIYRDDSQGEKVILTSAELHDQQTLDWQQHPLTNFSVGAWEPSFDPQQWHLNNAAHLPVQQVEQLDGSDHQAADAPAKPFSLLIVNP
jgi:hypothetical protein